MFIIQLCDRERTPLNLGDIVAISTGKLFRFYCRITWLEKEKAIAPFHTFSFHSILKVDSVPDNAVKSYEERYDIWFVPNEAHPDTSGEAHKKYLMEWRKCESFLESCYSVEPFKG